jgi:hypothetical protein
LETVLQRSPKHPLALHLYIHAIEASSKSERAEIAVDTLLDLMPGAGHLVHMPSHIYWRVGRYRDASEANYKPAAIDQAYISAVIFSVFMPLLIIRIICIFCGLHTVWRAGVRRP